jgi:hypothetical protein
MSGRAEALRRIDDALAEVGAIEAALLAAREGRAAGIDGTDLGRRFGAIAHAGAGHVLFSRVGELAVLAGKVTDDAGPHVLQSEQGLEVVQHAADVLSLLLRDMGHQLLGRRGADVTPLADALRERLERQLLVGSR